MTRPYIIALGAAILSFATPIAHAETVAQCNTLAVSINAVSAEVAELQADRASQLIITEDAGDAWEGAEPMRSLGQDYAELADQTASEYEREKGNLARVQSNLVEKANRFNAQVNRFNSVCATDEG